MIRRLGELWGTSFPAFWLLLAACVYFAVMAARLTVIDVRHHLLPNRIVFPSYAIAGALLLGAAVAVTLAGGAAGPAPDGGAPFLGVPALGIVAGGAVLWVFYFILRLVYPPGMGFGDVKLAGVLGLYLGYLGWAHVFAGTFAAFLFGGLWSLGVLAARRGTLKSSIPFGPFMLAGAAAAMFALPA
ncbi:MULTISPECIES: A24 family peptidase [Arthrobacter]|uniref:Leader peptidase (Prepilin peptidase)/N-methyltransferase n=1 Tax=Arthrobacter bambusae TaxID=1338426 RepID=A0AAW8DA65_9MICC|nr:MULTISPECIES: A24 family peptidase [Arthrobacter]MDP9905197.1 leader peptidase (prepilin peptidase)/N-methyltransferase [Arthrobacter bambusae]MDQ0129325.1 leader peptidase (prepilin peptidase)/N-methyltransferase [Arthrobacter bambusae]MDQ0180329.1 leader peptidase (prepilin peptidase)/N-methyltransferase [Arthrobacter bambusae]